MVGAIAGDAPRRADHREGLRWRIGWRRALVRSGSDAIVSTITANALWRFLDPFAVAPVRGQEPLG
ncbi:hypothetical protein LX81_03439 [Palleronia aestuarii]|uniref:Uncharacterized protein n=1 Tax=Palleronia aestuarii TaxID=568105 RepID=A0A2W7MY12_9RHOB|nr:hypothetical protein LX81_03439 [Palleronia aestuarii]